MRFGFEDRQSRVGRGRLGRAHMAFWSSSSGDFAAWRQRCHASLPEHRYRHRWCSCRSRTRRRRRWRRRSEARATTEGRGSGKKDPISVPVEKKPDPTPKAQGTAAVEMTLPFQPMSAAEMTLPGVFHRRHPRRAAPDRPGHGRGLGTGLGPGAGFGGGFGGGAYRPAPASRCPGAVREVKPAYTADAMRAKVQGSVWLECIVMPDGTVGDVKVTRSLDPIFGLDQEAIKAAKHVAVRARHAAGRAGAGHHHDRADLHPAIGSSRPSRPRRAELCAHDAHDYSLGLRARISLRRLRHPSRAAARSRIRRRRGDFVARDFTFQSGERCRTRFTTARSARRGKTPTASCATAF